MSIFLSNNTSLLLIFRKSIFKIASNLVLDVKKDSSKNLDLLILFYISKIISIISKVFRIELSIFSALM